METVRIFEHGNMDARRMARPVLHPGPRLLRKGLRIGPHGHPEDGPSGPPPRPEIATKCPWKWSPDLAFGANRTERRAGPIPEVPGTKFHVRLWRFLNRRGHLRNAESLNENRNFLNTLPSRTTTPQKQRAKVEKHRDPEPTQGVSESTT